MINQVVKASRGILRNKVFFSEVARSTPRAPSRRDSLQFSKARLVDFGELPHGEIPEALKYTRPSSLTKLGNGVRVATESWADNYAAVTVTVKAGSRQENINNSSVSQFISRLVFQGTNSKSRTDIDLALDRLGGQVDVQVERELTRFSIFVRHDAVNEAVALLADCLINPTFDEVQVEAAKPGIHRNASSMDPETNTLESIHYTSFRDHFLGQPTSGIRDNIYSITADQIKEFHRRHYVGSNIVVSAAGNVNADAFNDVVAQHFGNLRENVEGQVENTEKPLFTPSLMFQRDDELPNTSIGAFFVAPGWNDADFFAMNYFKRIIGEYQVDRHTGAHLNTPKLQYNSYHTDLGNHADIILQKPFYFAYSDVGIFGNFLFGNEVFNRYMILSSQNKMSEYAQDINQAEVFRARNKYWNDLLNKDCPIRVSISNSKQAAYLDRLISRTEIATRISNMDPNYIQNVASKWFWDTEIAGTAWGPLHNMMTDAHYNRAYRRSTLGEYSMVRVKLDY